MKLGRNYFEGVWLLCEAERRLIKDEQSGELVEDWVYPSYKVNDGLFWHFTYADLLVSINGEYLFASDLILWNRGEKIYITRYVFNATQETLEIVDPDDRAVVDIFKVTDVTNMYRYFRIEHFLETIPNPDYPERKRVVRLIDLTSAMEDGGELSKNHRWSEDDE